jgi:hypothetical protein
MAETDNDRRPSRAKRAGTRKARPARLLPEACAAATAFTASAEAALGDLEQRRPTGVGPLEQALAARVRSAAAQLLACANQVACDGLMVCGSMGQERAHPLLKVIAELRRELADGLKELTFRVEQAEMIVRMNGLPRTERLSSKEMTDLVLETILESAAAAETADRPDG